jgi:uncharacterized integral membrane protein
MLGSDDTTKMPTVDGPPAGTSLPRPTSPPPSPPPSSLPRRARDRSGALIGGTIILLIGLWFFATTTLGLELPRIDWHVYWPVILIVVGLLVILRAFRRSA